MVTHDARLVSQVEADLWICERGGIFKFNGEFEEYRQALIVDMAKREKDAEDQRAKAREARRMGQKAPKIVNVTVAEPSVALLGKDSEDGTKKIGGVSVNLEGFSLKLGKLKKKVIVPLKGPE